jgi:DNA ligase-associated metallophosphoesterase
MTIDICGVELVLLCRKALYKPDEKLLVIADVHLGKATHFRKHGIAIPAKAQQGDYDNLRSLLNETGPEKVYFLGDLFHSDFNGDWHTFCDLIKEYPGIQFTLIKGNHDIINKQMFKEVCIDVVDIIEDGPLVYTHEPLKQVPDGKVNIIGHIHPGVVLSGMGRQHVKLPCFYREEQLLVLPAFGVLTGLYSMDIKAATAIYLVLSDSVRAL